MRFLLLTAAVVVLSACGADDPGVVEQEDAYLAELRETVPTGVVEGDREEWLKRGWDACVAVSEDGLPAPVVVGQWAIMQDVSEEYAAAGFEAARVHLCSS